MPKTENPETATDNKTEKPKLTQKNGKNRKSQRPPPICMDKVPDDENCVMLLPQTMRCYH